MVFKRRKQRTFLQRTGDAFWPKGGWGRAASYIWHRLQRLPDPPHKIARGIAAGVFVSFSPFFGFHFVYAALVAFLIQGNILAALMATFFGNPLTFPIIATVALEMGALILGSPEHIYVHNVVFAFSRAALDLWQNLVALFTDRDANWAALSIFYRNVFLPYLVGGFLPGLVSGYIAFRLSVPTVTAYHKMREKKRRERAEKRRLAKLKSETDLARKAD